MSKLVQELVRMEVLFMKADSVDSRSKRVFLKTSGPLAIQKGFEGLMIADRLLMDQLGQQSYMAVLKKVTDLVETLHSARQN